MIVFDIHNDNVVDVVDVAIVKFVTEVDDEGTNYLNAVVVDDEKTLVNLKNLETSFLDNFYEYLENNKDLCVISEDVDGYLDNIYDDFVIHDLDSGDTYIRVLR